LAAGEFSKELRRYKRVEGRGGDNAYERGYRWSINRCRDRAVTSGQMERKRSVEKLVTTKTKEGGRRTESRCGTQAVVESERESAQRKEVHG
jgi:hypothetical protein